MGKRKGDDVLVSAPTHMVGDSHNTNHTSHNNTNHTNVTATSHTTSTVSSQPTWLDSASFDHKLWVVRETLKLEGNHGNDPQDDFLAEIQHCQEHCTAFQQQQQQLTSVSSKIQTALSDKIRGEESKCQTESANVSAMEQAVQGIVQERDSLQQGLQSLESLRHDLEQRIASAMEEASQHVESIDMVEESRKNQVPRLKHQISLYASTTGIKWDFDKERLLQGHVVRTVFYYVVVWKNVMQCFTHNIDLFLFRFAVHPLQGSDPTLLY
jgi:DNA repair exonuclease SbcCD ATPase subunit